ncbi:6573_t:CDS:2, partial [Racocetra fulgida]
MALIKMLEYFDNEHPIDLLFANADDSDAVEWEDAWKRLIEVNYMGNICTVMTVYKKMKERNFGQIAMDANVNSTISSKVITDLPPKQSTARSSCPVRVDMKF